MRLGINTLFLVPGDVGGTEVYLRNTLTAMAEELQQTGDALVLFTNQENDSLLRSDFAGYPQVEFHKVSCRAAVRPLRILAEQFLLPFAARKQQVDVLWSPGYTAPAICFSPQAVTIHDLQYKSYPEDMTRLERIVLDVLVRAACRRCQAVLTVSEFSRQEVLRYGFAEVEKVHAVLNGVQACFANPLPGSSTAEDDSADQALHGLDIRRPFLLCVAHTYPHKNVDKLIAAFALVQDRISHQLVLVGKGRRGEQAVQKSLLNLNEPNRVIRLHGLAEKELRVLYQEAAIFVLPSSYEGFGLPVVEAMMAGLPVVTVMAASLPEVGGEHAFYVNAPEPPLLTEKIMEVLTLPDEERELRITQGRQWAESFTWKRTAVQTLRVLRSIVREKKS